MIEVAVRMWLNPSLLTDYLGTLLSFYYETQTFGIQKEELNKPPQTENSTS